MEGFCTNCDSWHDDEESCRVNDVIWFCRFHPTDWFHEVGCPHKEWSNQELRDALIQKKKFEQEKLKREYPWSCENRAR